MRTVTVEVQYAGTGPGGPFEVIRITDAADGQDLTHLVCPPRHYDDTYELSAALFAKLGPVKVDIKPW